MIFPLKEIVDTRYPEQGLQDIKKAECSHVCLDFSMFFDKDGHIKNKYTMLIEKLTELQFYVDIAVLPDISEEKLYEENGIEKYIKISEECIKISEEIGCYNIILQPFINNKDSVRVSAGKTKEYCMELSGKCKNNATKLLLYNKCKNIEEHYVRGFLSNEENIISIIDELNLNAGREQFGFALDTGSCNLCGQDMNEMAKKLNEYVKAVIIRENNGRDDFSALPFTNYVNGVSGTNWLSFIRGLRSISSEPLIFMDFSTTAFNFSQILRPQLLKFAKSVGDYFEWQIGIEKSLEKYKSIVLFGAGNMCRNFMKCYGEKYLPLFTCDNNSSVWGQKFEGLEIKSPEALKEISSDCGVFICNSYYREIESQLKNLGVKNIEYFNDEYMPSFYFDRIERREL